MRVTDIAPRLHHGVRTHQPGEAITIALVDDHVLVRSGVREILEAEPDLRVVGEAGDSEGAVVLAAETTPHILLLDIEIPGDDAATTVRRLHEVSPATRVVVLSMHDGPVLLRTLLALGIRGYLLKSVTRQELVTAVRTACADNGRIALSVSHASLTGAQGYSSDALSDRERAVLTLVAQAMSNAQIAARLSLTEATVKRHLRNIFVKLDAVSRIDAVNKAVSAALIEAPRLSAHRVGTRSGRLPEVSPHHWG
ncbi:MAG TPA: response regulator transcription factor [Streptosporangiaceae bacterium]|nr:response regulator transcription factor [Streptosporangiaceae bacterium]